MQYLSDSSYPVFNEISTSNLMIVSAIIDKYDEW